MRFMNRPKRPEDLFELALSGLGSMAERRPLTLVSTGRTTGALNESPGVVLDDFAMSGFGEGIRDGLTEVADAVDGERPKVERPE